MTTPTSHTTTGLRAEMMILAEMLAALADEEHCLAENVHALPREAWKGKRAALRRMRDSHAALVEACQAAYDKLAHDNFQEDQGLITILRAALAQAEGREPHHERV